MIEIFANSQELAHGAAEYFVARSIAAVEQKGFFTVALSGGSTPKVLYQLLADTKRHFTLNSPGHGRTSSGLTNDTCRLIIRTATIA